MTANATTDDRKACELAGMDGYLSKPVVPERIVEAIKNCRRRDDDEDGAPLDFNEAGLLDLCQMLEREGAAEVVAAMIDELPKHEQSVQRALAERDTKSLRRAAHTLKGSCLMLHANGLASLCEHIENEAVAGVIDPNDHDIVEMLRRYDLLVHHAQQYLARPEQS